MRTLLLNWNLSWGFRRRLEALRMVQGDINGCQALQSQRLILKWIFSWSLRQVTQTIREGSAGAWRMSQGERDRCQALRSWRCAGLKFDKVFSAIYILREREGGGGEGEGGGEGGIKWLWCHITFLENQNDHGMPRIAEMEISTMQADCFPITITRQREDLGGRGWGVGGGSDSTLCSGKYENVNEIDTAT